MIVNTLSAVILALCGLMVLLLGGALAILRTINRMDAERNAEQQRQYQAAQIAWERREAEKRRRTDAVSSLESSIETARRELEVAETEAASQVFACFWDAMERAAGSLISAWQRLLAARSTYLGVPVEELKDLRAVVDPSFLNSVEILKP